MPHHAHRRVRAGAALAVVALLALAACGDDGAPTVAAGQPSTTTAAPATTPTTAGGSVTTPTTAPATTSTTAGTVLAVTVRGGQVVEGASRQRATLNQPVTIRVTSDRVDHVHVHGYDKFADVGPAKVGEITFVPNIPGVFEVELEDSGRLLFTLEVR